MSQPTTLRRVPRVTTPGGAGTAVVPAAERRLAIGLVACVFTLAAVLPAVAAHLPSTVLGAVAQEEAAHLLISEVMTGGAGASDEFVELYNPTTAELPLEGLELVYVSATGVTVTRRASWPIGAPSVPAHGHHLLANDLGTFSGIGDTLYAGGMAATGGSVALRIQGATTALDAVGWGTAASAWLEGTPAPAPPAGQSIERLPGGSAGSATDTGDNFVDFVVREVPDPQNAGSPPVPGASLTASPSPADDPSPEPTFTIPSQSPEASPDPEPSGSVSPSPEPTFTPTPAPAPLTVAATRARPIGSVVIVTGVTLSDSAFTDGGGFIADASGGLAVLVTEGSFPRGVTLTVTGELDDRYSQRTIRAGSDGLLIGGQATAPAAVVASSGSIGEAHEGELVRVTGTIVGAPTELASGLAFEVDDGSGPARVLVGPSTGIATTSWVPGAAVAVVGVVSQRDTTGTGVEGYRLLPRDAGDVISVERPPEPTPSTSSTPAATPQPSTEEPKPTATAEPGGDGAPLVSIAQARAAATGEDIRVRGVVTVPSGLIDRSTAIIQDATAAIMLRLGGEVGRFRRGEAVEVTGTRSTKSGMLTLRVSAPPRRLGSSPEPVARRIGTGEAGEALEAQLVVARGTITEAARRSSSGSVTFDIDDGSGELRVHLPASLRADRTGLASGAWVEVIGALGQQTTGGQRGSGYRIWPRSAAELTILAPATDGEAGTGGDDDDDGDDDDGPGSGRSGERGRGALDQLLPGAPGGAPRTVEATLVIGGWPELGVAGVLWDGRHAIGIAPDATGQRAVAAALEDGAPPRAVRVTASRAASATTPLELPVVALPEAGSLARGRGRPRAPLTALPANGVVAWVRLTGRLDRDGPGLAIAIGERRVLLSVLCRATPDPGGLRAGEVVEVQGLAAGQRLIGVPCGGVRAAPGLAAMMVGAAQDGAPPGSSAHAAPRHGASVLDLLPIVLGSSAVSGGGLLAAAAWRTGAFARLMASFAPASAPGTGPEEESLAGDDRGERPPRLSVVRLPPHGGE